MKNMLVVLCLTVCCVAQAKPSSPNRPAITGIAHVAFYARSLPESAHFYSHLLGLQQVGSPEASNGQSFYLSPAQRIDLIAQPSPSGAGMLDHIAFATTDAEALRVYLAARQVEVPSSVSSDHNGDRFFRTRDFEGHQIEFVQVSKPRSETATNALSHRIIHAGLIVHDHAAADRFYKDLLGFHTYWHGGRTDSETDWVDMQVPEGTDWIEYMLNVPADASARQVGVMNHVALGVANVHAAADALRQKGWKESEREQPKIGRDGKWQLNLYDPDSTRIEMMEFRPVRKPCCSEYSGRHPE